MRILFVNKYAHLTGGADQHCLGLARALRDRGHEIAFLSTESTKNKEADGAFVRAHVTHVTRDDLGTLAAGRVAVRAFWNREAARAMQRLIAEFEPDVVHTHKLYPQLSVAPVIVARRFGIPVVQTLHDFEFVGASPIDARGGWFDTDDTRATYRALNSATLPVRKTVHARRVGAFIAVSRFVARIYAAHGIEAQVFPNFVLERAGDGPVPSFDDREGVLFLGRLQPEKGVKDVIELAERIPDHKVSVVGSGNLLGEVEAAAERLPNLTAHGFVPDPALTELVRRARVMVVPSRCQDAGPLVPLEAMREGTPVVAYANGGLAEYVADAESGEVVPSDVDALARASREVHDDRALWQEFSANGLAAVEDTHSRARYVERLEQLYGAVS